MRILKFEAENIKKLKVVSITPQGNVVEVTGANGAGKSSVLDAIFYALGGAAGMPTQPLHKGAEAGFVKLDLGGLTVTRHFTATDSRLVVEAQNGARFPSPQRILDELLGKLTFDPLAFTRMDSKKQLETIRGIVKLDVDIDKLDADNKILFEARTGLNREIKSLDAQAAATVVAEDTPDSQVDITALVNELEAAGEHNIGAAHCAADLKTMKERFTHYASESIRLAKLAQEAQEQADDFAKRIEAHVVVESKDTAELKAKIAIARNVNDQVSAKKRRDDLYAQAKLNRLGVEDLELKMGENNGLKNAAIRNAKMPIDGLQFGEGEVLWNDLPLSQASSAEQLRVSVAVAMAANPKLKVLRIQDGSLLDDASMKLLAEMATAADYQVWIETVHSSNTAAVVMEDGEVKQ